MENHPFLALFSRISASIRAYLPTLTPSTTTLCSGNLLANSRRTKQFLGCFHSL
jgi:hypothetical protein